MEKHAIFLDIDNTLSFFDDFPNGGTVSKENVNAINAARQKGHYVFLNTGRSYAWINKFVLDAVEVDGVISGIGTQVLFRGETIFEKPIEKETILKILRAVEDADCFVLFGGTDRIFTINKPDYQIQNNPISIASAEEFEGKYSDAKIQKVELFPAPDKAKAILERYLQYFHHDGYSEGCPRGVSKSSAMLLTIEKLGIPKERCIAMGDSINDIDMLKAAGIGVAMGNASDEVKAVSDFISLPCRENGVAYAINKLLLEKE